MSKGDVDADRTPRVVVIGAGAAGLVASAEAANCARQRGTSPAVTLLEKNSKTGVKILMSGGTRCNVTQDTDAKGIATAFGRAGRFLQKSVGAFGPADVVRMFHRLGVATKVESTGKVFPVSDRAIHVRDALHQQAVASGVELRLRTPVTDIWRDGDVWKIAAGKDETISAERVIVTAGGRSWPGCGTTGDAYAWLKKLGHRIIRTRPALVPLVGGTEWTRSLSGLTLPDCIASIYRSDQWNGAPSKKIKPLASRRSSWLFTHFGFSGPAAMDVSGTITEATSFDETKCIVDFVPDCSEAACLEIIRQGGGRRKLSTALGQWLPSRFATSLADESGGDVALAELTKPQTQRLIRSIKYAELPITGTRGFEKAEVTAGGVALDEIDPRTMESKRHPGLFIAGEVLDVDGWIGGYNFQAAFSTGRAAGLAAAVC